MSDYISELHVVNCWAFRDRRFALDGRRHLVLLGPNGSGKTTILQATERALGGHGHTVTWQRVPESRDALSRTNAIVVPAIDHPSGVTPPRLSFAASRSFNGEPVDGPMALEAATPRHRPRSPFVQFLVNRRTEQAYAREEGDDAKADGIARWFDVVAEQLSELAGEPLELRFTRDRRFAFDLVHSDGRLSPFEHLPAGYASVLEILSGVIMGLDAARRTVDDPFYLLIDEPEVHLQPRLQLSILPTLARLFPGAQLIVATHAPLVAASLPDAAVFDLTTGAPVRIYGLDPNAALVRVFGTNLQPTKVRELIAKVATDIDRDPPAARASLGELEAILGPDHDEIVRQKTLLSLLGVNPDAADREA